jgi:flagellar capping protein FliD
LAKTLTTTTGAGVGTWVGGATGAGISSVLLSLGFVSAASIALPASLAVGVVGMLVYGGRLGYKLGAMLTDDKAGAIAFELVNVTKQRDELLQSLTDGATNSSLQTKIDSLTKAQQRLARDLESAAARDAKNGTLTPQQYAELTKIVEAAKLGKFTYIELK